MLGGTTDSGGKSQVDQLLSDLGDRLRREVLRYFEEYADGGTGGIDELAAHIDRRLPERSDRSVRMELYHVHLPQLDDGSWLDFDRQTGSIRYRGREDAIETLDEVRDIFA